MTAEQMSDEHEHSTKKCARRIKDYSNLSCSCSVLLNFSDDLDLYVSWNKS